MANTYDRLTWIVFVAVVDRVRPMGGSIIWFWWARHIIYMCVHMHVCIYTQLFLDLSILLVPTYPTYQQQPPLHFSLFNFLFAVSPSKYFSNFVSFFPL